MNKPVKRYNSIAISLHWLIAFFVLALVVIGNYMTGLEQTDPQRYALTQWHKSFGISVLVLVLLRVAWRLVHKPPKLPQTTTRFEKLGSSMAHFGLYVLMLAIPLSGWVMVSGSPLNLPTELFGLFNWPHIGLVEASENKDQIAGTAENLHHILAKVLIALVVLHMSAAFYHHLCRRDGMISRMVISSEPPGVNNHGLFYGGLIVLAGCLFLYGYVGSKPSSETAEPADASAASVGFIATQSGNPIVGEFKEVELALQLNPELTDTASLTALVTTASVSSGDSQIDGTLVGGSWFAAKEFPQARFASTHFEKITDAEFVVTGDLTIRDVSRPVVFTLTVDDFGGRGSVSIDRNDYGIGVGNNFADAIVVLEFVVPASVSE